MPGTLHIRADAGPEMGSGHVMRCLAIARAWMRHGGDAVMLSHALEPELQARLQRLGVAHRPVPAAWPDPQDLQATSKALHPPGQGKNAPSPWLVLDGYHFDARYMEGLAQAGAKLCVVDDLGDRPFFPARLVVNPNCYARELQYHGPPGMRALLGSAYVMLREEFLALQPRPAALAAKPGGKLLVTLGGGDSSEILLNLLDIIADAQVENMHVRLVTGFACSRYAELLRRAAAQPYRCELFRAVENMALQLAWAEGAISAAGGTSWELAYAGVPAGLVVLAGNQTRIAAELSQSGAAMFLGNAANLPRESTAAAIRRLLTDARLRQSMVEAGQHTVDGRGAERIVAAMREDHRAGCC